ncbi:MAG: hypothetical protein B5M53_00370 [Candidatus Cloacimonas sp. 4484_209]|nr:MAG: hypothetical protein B5M53_00370 [Candidatus Cloacimonas sp. 4484_209]
MKKIYIFFVLLFVSTSLSATIPSEQVLQEFLSDLNKPLALTINGGNFTSSSYLPGIPHFLVESGISGIQFNMRNPEGEGKIKTAISMFNIKANFGIFRGFSLMPNWKGFLGLEAGIKGSEFPLLGNLLKYKKKYPFIFSLSTKCNFIKSYHFIPNISFSFEYSQLFDEEFQFIDESKHETASCSFNHHSLYYHIDMREKFALVDFYAGIGWISSALQSDYTIVENTGSFTSENISINKFYFGITIPVELIDVSLEFGRSGSYGFYGAAFGFKM